MKEIILAKGGEFVLKGTNRRTFVDTLLKNIRQRMSIIGPCEVQYAQSTLCVTPQDEWFDIDEAYEAMGRIFGIIALTRAAVCDKDMDAIRATTLEYLSDKLERARTFKVEARRSDKKFPMNSPQICQEMGGFILSKFHHLKVDVHNPDVTVYVEIRDFGVYIHAGNEKGAGGLPLGTSGKATLLLSGGIDSPVAGYMIAKRGVAINAVHFYSYPYTSERAKEKVIELARRMCDYCGTITLFVVPFTDIQIAIRDQVKEEYFTIIMRRYMMKIAQTVAERGGSLGLITGESIGQVASQTLAAMNVTGHGLDLQVYRPLIGMDKEDIIQIARRIDTFETSILPYEDCCTVFTPRHPRIRPALSDVLRMEEKLDFADMMAEAIANMEILHISPKGVREHNTDKE